jgi:hypothetical protein
MRQQKPQFVDRHRRCVICFRLVVQPPAGLNPSPRRRDPKNDGASCVVDGTGDQTNVDGGQLTTVSDDHRTTFAFTLRLRRSGCEWTTVAISFCWQSIWNGALFGIKERPTNSILTTNDLLIIRPVNGRQSAKQQQMSVIMRNFYYDGDRAIATADSIDKLQQSYARHRTALRCDLKILQHALCTSSRRIMSHLLPSQPVYWELSSRGSIIAWMRLTPARAFETLRASNVCGLKYRRHDVVLVRRHEARCTQRFAPCPLTTSPLNVVSTKCTHLRSVTAENYLITASTIPVYYLNKDVTRASIIAASSASHDTQNPLSDLVYRMEKTSLVQAFILKETFSSSDVTDL